MEAKRKFTADTPTAAAAPAATPSGTCTYSNTHGSRRWNGHHTVHPLDEMNLHFSLAAVQLGFLSSFLDFLFRISSKLAQSFLTKSRHSTKFSLLCFSGVASHCPQRVPWYCYVWVQFTARNMHKKNTACHQNTPFVFVCVMLHS